MILHELTGGNEKHPAYKALELANSRRHYNFLQSIIVAALDIQRPFLSQTVIKAINYHAIACLHTNAGEYRPCPVKVGPYIPPEHFRVSALMDDFVNNVNRVWEQTDAVALATYVLWRLNNIHPFINGNGRTARASAYFVLCLKSGGLLRGDTILPDLLLQNRDEYIAALRVADGKDEKGNPALQQLHSLVVRLLRQQVGQAEQPPLDEQVDDERGSDGNDDEGN